jgi:hypothetical protein
LPREEELPSDEVRGDRSHVGVDLDSRKIQPAAAELEGGGSTGQSHLFQPSGLAKEVEDFALAYFEIEFFEI